MFKVYDDVYVQYEDWYLDFDSVDDNPNFNIEPVVGMGCTYKCGSDRYAYTIIEVISPKKIIVRDDVNGCIDIISKRKDKRWREVASKCSFTYELGYRHYEIDRGF